LFTGSKSTQNALFFKSFTLVWLFERSMRKVRIWRMRRCTAQKKNTQSTWALQRKKKCDMNAPWLGSAANEQNKKKTCFLKNVNVFHPTPKRWLFWNLWKTNATCFFSKLKPARTWTKGTKKNVPWLCLWKPRERGRSFYIFSRRFKTFPLWWNMLARSMSSFVLMRACIFFLCF